MIDGRALASELVRRAREEGFALAGIASVEPSAHIDFYRVWLDAGHHGEMAYLAREDAVRRRADLRETMPEARSCLVVAQEYGVADPPGVPDDPSRAVISRYARGRDYHVVMRRKLDALLAWLDERVEAGVRGRAYVDTGPLLERELAARAGLGWFGKNTVLIHPGRGSWFFVGVLLLDLELPADPPFTEDRCGSCTACLDACPTGALLGRDERGAPVIDARRCISYLTIEQRGAIPAELRPAIGNRVFGCDICQEVCPFTRKFSVPTSEPGFAPRGPNEQPFGVQPEPGTARPHPGTGSPSLIALLETALDPEAWNAFTRGSALRRAGRAGLARNVCVAIGNWGSPQGVPVLISALVDPDPLVRGHAVWALGRIRSPAAVSALEQHADRESDPWVAEEISAALAR